MLLAAALALRAAGAARADSAGAGTQQQQAYGVGIGVADITGPAADVELMGYANVNQTAKGLHTRQWARAFVFADKETQRRFLLVNIDAAMASQLVTIRVIQRLQAEYGGLYSSDNVAITATHTHASAAGFLEHFLYHITSLGFVKETFEAMVDGIVEATRAAHASVRPATLSWAEGELLGANINRSPTAYAANPSAERARYTWDVDKDMTVLRIHSADADAKGRGLLSWFPVHCTSLNNTNRLLSSDNKGAAQQLVEKRWAPAQASLERPFVAAFVQANVADTSPNVQGTFCADTGAPCDPVTSTCGGDNALCLGRGPAWPDDTKSAEIIGQLQADKAQELWLGPGRPISGPVDYRHTYVAIGRGIDVAASNFTRAGRTCPGAMGYSFAAGTTDGPGMSGFHQSDTHTGFSQWSLLVALVNGAAHSTPGPQQRVCQGAKPILLNVGEAPKPYPWVPQVTEVSLLRLGNFFIVCVPGEFTTMAGRRMREAVAATLQPAFGADVKVVLSGLTNTYSSYVTTYEEYQAQRYEGGSTLYGPHTLDAYIQAVLGLAAAMAAGQPVPPSPAVPADFEAKTLSLLPPVVLDTAHPGDYFGKVLRQPRPATQPYAPGETVEALFCASSPRNNLRRGGTFLEVQRAEQPPGGGDGGWVTVAADDDWDTKFVWDRPKGPFSSESTATIRWTVPPGARPGTYRILYHGDAKGPLGKLAAFTGTTQPFSVAAAAGGGS